MKMKKTYAAALAAAMVLTAGLSAQAARLNNDGSIVISNGMWESDTITQQNLEDSLNGQGGAELHLNANSTIGTDTIATGSDISGLQTQITDAAMQANYAGNTATSALTQAQANAGNIADLQETVNGHTEQIGTLQTQVAANTAFANTVAQDVAKNKNDIAGLQTEMGGKVDNSTLEQVINAQNENLQGVQKNLEQNIAGVEKNLGNWIDLAHQKVDTVDGELDQEKIDRAAADQGLQDQITNNKENIGSLQETVGNHIDEDGNISGANGTFTGTVSGTTGKFDSITVGDIPNGTGTQINGDGSIVTTGPITSTHVNTGKLDVAGGKFHVDETTGKVTANGGMTVNGDVLMQNGQGESIIMTEGGAQITSSDMENGTGSVIVKDGEVTLIGNNTTQVNVDKDGTTFTDRTTGTSTNISGDKITTGAVNTGSISVADGDFTVSESGMIQSQTGGVIGGVTINSGNVKAEGQLTAANGQFAVDRDTGSITTDGALSVAQGANINGGLAVNGGASINGGLTVDGTDVMGSIADNADKIAQNTTAIANNSSRINALDRKVSDLGGEIDNVGAISSALAGLHPLDYDGTGSKFQLAAAMGSYDGTQAAAIGGFYHFNEDIMMSVGGATSFGGDNKSAFNVGLSFRVGQGSSGKRVSNDEVLAQLTAMNDKIAALEAENQQLSEKVAALEGGEGAEAAEAE